MDVYALLIALVFGMDLSNKILTASMRVMLLIVLILLRNVPIERANRTLEETAAPVPGRPYACVRSDDRGCSALSAQIRAPPALAPFPTLASELPALVPLSTLLG